MGRHVANKAGIERVFKADEQKAVVRARVLDEKRGAWRERDFEGDDVKSAADWVASELKAIVKEGE